MIIFKEIEIIGLFGESDICIPISDNRLILVGYNGIGKSTILNIFYYFISQQWHKLQEQDFSSVTLRLRNKKRKLSINRTELLEYIEFQRRDRRGARYGYRFPQVLLKDAYDLLSKRYGHFAGAQLKSTTRHEIEFLREELNVPTRVAEELVREYRYMTQREFEFASSVQDNIAKVDQFISENLGGRILYLPTYRRIEKDLKTVFPEIEEELQRKLSRRRNETSKTESYIELVYRPNGNLLML